MTDVRNLIEPGRELAGDALERVRGLSEPARERAGDAAGYVKRQRTITRLLVALVAGVAIGLLVRAVVVSRRADEETPDEDDARRPAEAVRARGA